MTFNSSENGTSSENDFQLFSCFLSPVDDGIDEIDEIDGIDVMEWVKSPDQPHCSKALPEEKKPSKSLHHEESVAPVATANLMKSIPRNRIVCHEHWQRARVILIKWFIDHIENPYPTIRDAESLAELTCLSTQQIYVFFRNYRQRLKRKIPSFSKYWKIRR
jgi:hypothetical protein